MLSTDANILEIGSPVYNRMHDYARGVQELHIVVLCGKKTGVQFHDGNLHIYPTNSEKKLQRFFDAYDIAAEIIETRDLAQEDSLITCQDPFEVGFVGVRLKKRFGLKLQLQIHTDFSSKFFLNESIKNRIRSYIAWHILPDADGIRVVSDRILTALLSKKNSGIDEKKCSVLPIYVDVEKIHNTESINLSKKFPGFTYYIAMVSRFTEEKQILWAANIVGEIRKTHPGICLVIVGDGPLRAALEKIEYVRVTGWLTEPIGHIKGAQLFLNTSLYEGYGRSLVEAAAAGATIVTTDVGVARSVVEEGVNGFIVPVGDSEAIEKAIVDVIEHPSKLLGKQVRANSKEEYLAEHTASWQKCF